jgi:RNA polymerase sigma-70 factor (ECF subfamily)
VASAAALSPEDSTKANVFSREGINMSMSWKHPGAAQADTTGIEYLDGLYSYALVLARNHAEAEDLVQETYLRALQAMGRLRAGSNMKGWLFTILRNVWFNQLRKWRNGPQMLEIEVGDGVANGLVEQSKDAHDLYVGKLETEQVRAAILELPVQFREIIVLREYEDLSYREIASVLHCPVGTVMSRLGRARAKLSTLLATSGNLLKKEANRKFDRHLEQNAPNGLPGTSTAQSAKLAIDPKSHYDSIVCGSGSPGSVVARRESRCRRALARSRRQRATPWPLVSSLGSAPERY